MGVGSICRRSMTHPQHGLRAVLQRLDVVWPRGTRAHFFGVKGTALRDLQALAWVASADSMAYDFGARIDARKRSISNSTGHRCAQMDAWMGKAAARMDQAQLMGARVWPALTDRLADIHGMGDH